MATRLPEPVTELFPPEPEADLPLPERLRMLLEARKATEDTLRSFDVKAQIAGVSLILSVTGFVTLTTMLLPARAVPHPAVGFVLCGALLACVALFAWVLWPARVPRIDLGEGGAPVQSTFYVPAQPPPRLDDYMACIRRTDWERELAFEIMKLACLRNSKAKRFKRALFCSLSFYVALMLAAGMSLAHAFFGR